MRRFLLVLLTVALLPACTVKLDLEGDIIEGEDSAVCWMERLADDTPLTALTIPGAHDAASSSITSWTLWTRTQEKNVAELWNCGVRAFDLRPALVDGELGIYHDKYSAHVSFPQVMQAPVGIVMMDFASVDRSNGVSVGGAKLVNALIENN